VTQKSFQVHVLPINPVEVNPFQVILEMLILLIELAFLTRNATSGNYMIGLRCFSTLVWNRRLDRDPSFPEILRSAGHFYDALSCSRLAKPTV